MKSKKTDNENTKRFAQANENGFLPNSFQTPNAIVDKYMPYLNSNELRVWLYACRHILGWQEKISSRRRRISVRMFESGYGSFPGCGLTISAIVQALKGLSKYGLLVKIGEANQDGQMWEIPSKETKIDLPGLVARQDEITKKNAKKTIKARQALLKKREPKEDRCSVQQNTTCSVGQNTCDAENDESDAAINTLENNNLEENMFCETEHLSHLNGNAENGLGQNENSAGVLSHRTQVFCVTELNKPTFKPNTENNNYYGAVEKFLAAKNFVELAEFWWDTMGAPKWSELVAPKLNCAGQHPGALCGDREHLGLAELLERNLRSMTIDDFQKRYENYLQSDNYFYFERKYSLRVFCNEFKNLMTPNHARRKNANGTGAKLLNGGPGSGNRPGAAVVGSIAKNTRDPFEEYTSGNEFLASLSEEQRRQLEALPF